MTPDIPALSKLNKTKTEALAVTVPVLNTVALLQIKDAASYETGDALLKQIRIARKKVLDKLNPIIDPIREALDKLYVLRRDVELPLDSAETQIKGKMKAYMLEERKRLVAEEEARRQEAEKVRLEAEAIQRKAEKARSKVTQNILNDRASTLVDQAEQIETAKGDLPTKAAHSTVRVTRKAEVLFLKELLRGIISGEVPLDVVLVDTGRLAYYFKDSPGTVKNWPGVQVIEDVTIAGR